MFHLEVQNSLAASRSATSEADWRILCDKLAARFRLARRDVDRQVPAKAVRNAVPCADIDVQVRPELTGLLPGTTAVRRDHGHCPERPTLMGWNIVNDRARPRIGRVQPAPEPSADPRLFPMIADAVPLPMLHADSAGRITWLNQAAAERIDRIAEVDNEFPPSGDWIGRDVDDLLARSEAATEEADEFDIVRVPLAASGESPGGTLFIRQPAHTISQGNDETSGISRTVFPRSADALNEAEAVLASLADTVRQQHVIALDAMLDAASIGADGRRVQVLVMELIEVTRRAQSAVESLGQHCRNVAREMPVPDEENLTETTASPAFGIVDGY